jgi:hypothetical protein
MHSTMRPEPWKVHLSPLALAYSFRISMAPMAFSATQGALALAWMSHSNSSRLGVVNIELCLTGVPANVLVLVL